MALWHAVNRRAFRVMDLGHNQLSGSIPKAISRLSALKILNLRHNKLTGTIPSELHALTRLGVLCVPHCFPVLRSARSLCLACDLD